MIRKIPPISLPKIRLKQMFERIYYNRFFRKTEKKKKAREWEREREYLQLAAVRGDDPLQRFHIG